jgi:hypothetical protein
MHGNELQGTVEGSIDTSLQRNGVELRRLIASTSRVVCQYVSQEPWKVISRNKVKL